MKPGDSVKVTTKKETIEGVLLPSPELEKDIVVLKLPSGYNIGIDKKNVKDISLLSAAEDSVKPALKAPQKDAKKKTIALLHTGGTIASKIDYKSGGVIAHYGSEEMLAHFPELFELANIESRQIAQMQSEMMRFAHFNIIAREVAKEIQNGADAVIVTHGTDVLHYSAAALAFILENCPVPVILVGAQRSSDRGSSDASLNVRSAAYFAVNTDYAGVAICMHESLHDVSCLILPPTKTRKMHTSRRDAFRPINATAIARVNVDEQRIEYLQKDYSRRPKEQLLVKPFKEDIKVGIVKSYPNISAAQFQLFQGYDGLVLEGTGLGHVPNEKVDELSEENLKIYTAIATLAQTGTLVVDSSQCIYGRVHMDVYTPLRELQKVGVVGHFHDMTPETAYIKLAWLLSNYQSDEAKRLFTINMRGEISSESRPDTFLI